MIRRLFSDAVRASPRSLVTHLVYVYDPAEREEEKVPLPNTKSNFVHLLPLR